MGVFIKLNILFDLIRIALLVRTYKFYEFRFNLPFIESAHH